MNETSCGRGVRLAADPNSTAVARMAAGRTGTRCRHTTYTVTKMAATAAHPSHATAGRPPTASAPASPSSGSHSCSTHVRELNRASGSGPANCQVSASSRPVRMCQ